MWGGESSADWSQSVLSRRVVNISGGEMVTTAMVTTAMVTTATTHLLLLLLLLPPPYTASIAVNRHFRGDIFTHQG